MSNSRLGILERIESFCKLGLTPATTAFFTSNGVPYSCSGGLPDMISYSHMPYANIST